MEQRANIKFCFKLGKTFTETFELLKKVYGDDCLSRTRVFELYKLFQDGREALEDDPKVGWPKNKNRKELVQKVREMIAYKPNSTVKWMVEELNKFIGDNILATNMYIQQTKKLWEIIIFFLKGPRTKW